MTKLVQEIKQGCMSNIMDKSIGWVNPEKNILGLFLDLGSGNTEEGEYHPDGFVLQDIQAHKGIDLVCDIEEIDQFIKPEQCKRIRISHVLEHFPTENIRPLLKKLYKLLSTDGSLIVDVPNFKWHAALLLEEKDEEAITYAYGGQRDEYDFHKTAFTAGVLFKRLTEAGFVVKDITIEHSLHAFAIKNEQPSHN